MEEKRNFFSKNSLQNFQKDIRLENNDFKEFSTFIKEKEGIDLKFFVFFDEKINIKEKGMKSALKYHSTVAVLKDCLKGESINNFKQALKMQPSGSVFMINNQCSSQIFQTLDLEWKNEIKIGSFEIKSTFYKYYIVKKRIKVAVSILSYVKVDILKNTIESLISSDLGKCSNLETKNNTNCKYFYELGIFVWNNDPKKGKAFEFLTSLSENYNEESLKNKIIMKVFNEEKNYPIVHARIKIYEKILENSENIDYDYFVEVHDDMIFHSNWFEYIMDVDNDKLLQKKYNLNYERIGIIAPTIIIRVFLEQKKFNEQINSLILSSKEFEEDFILENCLQTHPWIIPFRVLHRTEYYRKDFYGGGVEDDELFLRIIGRYQFDEIVTMKSFVNHFTELTRSSPPMYSNQMIKNQVVFKEAFGGKSISRAQKQYLPLYESGKFCYPIFCSKELETINKKNLGCGKTN